MLLCIFMNVFSSIMELFYSIYLNIKKWLLIRDHKKAMERWAAFRLRELAKLQEKRRI